MKENLTNGAIFDINKSVGLYRDLATIYGPIYASELAEKIFADDLKSLAWEATKNPLPNRFFYQIVRDENSVKLVHQSDLHWNRDILEGVNPYFRRGLEFKAMSAFRKELFEAEIGGNRFLISSKRDETESIADCAYASTQINIAEKLNDDLIMVSQFQSDHLDKKRSVKLFNTLSDCCTIREDASNDELITTVGSRRNHISTEGVLDVVAQEVGRKINKLSFQGFRDWEERIEAQVRPQAQRLLQAIQSGTQGQALQETFSQALTDTLGLGEVLSFWSKLSQLTIMTSCGAITFGSNLRSYDRMPTLTFWSKEKKCIECKKHKKVGECGFCKDCEKKVA